MTQELKLKKRELKVKEREERLEGYAEILNDVRSLLEKAKYRAYKAVDNIRVQTYWQIGERIVRGELQHKERADYGERLIENLAGDLGFIKRDLYRMVQFYKTYPIVTSVMSQLSWTHYTVLISITDKEKRQFYESQTIKNVWSVRELRRQIKNNLHQRMKKEGEVMVTPIGRQIEPEEIFKDTYDFEFLNLPEDHSEGELKESLLKQVEDLLQELGSDFFIGRREVPVLIGGNYDRVDLELFHAGLLCYILVEIKTEPFKHSHVSQMYSYLNWYKENKWRQGQRQPIGLIICKTKDEETVHYALGDLKKEIFVSEYKTKLPGEEEIKEKLKEVNVRKK